MFYQRFRAKFEALKFKYVPKIADLAIRRSVTQSRVAIASMRDTRVLVDVTILQHGITHETAWISTGQKEWGPQLVDTGYAARVPVHAVDQSSREYRSVCYLASLAHLHKVQSIKLMTSAELDDEQFRQPVGRFRGYGYFDYNVLAGLDIPRVEQYLPIHKDLPVVFGGVSMPSDSGSQQRLRLAAYENTFPIYRELVTVLGRANSQDAWHIYTAERNNMFCFLTMDFRLLNAVSAQRNASPLKFFRTQVLSPEELGMLLRIRPVPPHLLSYNDASFPVRTARSMPNSKRRPLRGYRKGAP